MQPERALRPDRMKGADRHRKNAQRMARKRKARGSFFKDSHNER